MVSAVIRHDLTESTRAMAKRGSDDLKRLAAMQAVLVCYTPMAVWMLEGDWIVANVHS